MTDHVTQIISKWYIVFTELLQELIPGSMFCVLCSHYYLEVIPRWYVVLCSQNYLPQEVVTKEIFTHWMEIVRQIVERDVPPVSV